MVWYAKGGGGTVNCYWDCFRIIAVAIIVPEVVLASLHAPTSFSICAQLRNRLISTIQAHLF
jgi:hypothetical protein